MIRRSCALVSLLLLAISGGVAVAVETISVPPPNVVTPIRSPDGVTFEAYEWGSPNGRPIVFIHGIYQSALSWARQIGDPTLAAKYRLVAIDLRGHGASDKPDGPEFYRDGKRWADDITALLDTLHLSRPVMVPWSYGGRVLNDYLAVIRKALAGRPLAYTDVLRAIRVPTLIVQGDIDAVVSPQLADFTHKLIPHSSLSIYHGVGHSSFFEAPERFNAELDRFMEGLGR